MMHFEGKTGVIICLLVIGLTTLVQSSCRESVIRSYWRVMRFKQQNLGSAWKVQGPNMTLDTNSPKAEDFKRCRVPKNPARLFVIRWKHAYGLTVDKNQAVFKSLPSTAGLRFHLKRCPGRKSPSWWCRVCFTFQDQQSLNYLTHVKGSVRLIDARPQSDKNTWWCVG